ncbi:hypothetical protein GGR50DRAFT_663916 [Xylaria sp. CBS 124048]|nr:hypothetical protein GGR50DRAFT_663916 [Xylaria sp. CBS 124048]
MITQAPALVECSGREPPSPSPSVRSQKPFCGGRTFLGFGGVFFIFDFFLISFGLVVFVLFCLGGWLVGLVARCGWLWLFGMCCFWREIWCM